MHISKKITKTILSVLLVLSVSPIGIHAQSDSVVHKKSKKFSVTSFVDARFDYSFENPDVGDNTKGFHGRYFNLWVDGQINDKLMFHFRHRLNRQILTANDVFGATDWLMVDYKPFDRWTFTGGKMPVAVGGFEYDANPVDIYFASLLWNNVRPYQFGVSVTYDIVKGRHSLTAQVANSILADRLDEGMLSYSLRWNGNMDWFTTIWSVNVFEYGDGKCAQYISLGNKIVLGGLTMEIDYMNRHLSGNPFLFHDFSILDNMRYCIGKHVTLVAKVGYEQYKPDPGKDQMLKGALYGGGVEVFPIASCPDFRVYAIAASHHSAGDTRLTQFLVGATWRFYLLK